MKVVVTAVSPELNAQVDPRFGRAGFFVFVDTETLAFEAMPNPAQMASGGAGIQAAQVIVDKGAEAVITGQVGPKAFHALRAAGVKIYMGAQGTVMEALELFRSGKLQEATAPTATPHAGMARR